MKKLKILVALVLSITMLCFAACETIPDSSPDENSSSYVEPEDSSSDSSSDSTGSGDSTSDVIPEDPDEPIVEDSPLFVKFSIEGGTYSSPQKLELELPNTAPYGSYITYTTNGCEPTKDSTRYTRELTVANGNVSVIRAAYFNNTGERKSYISTETYVAAAADRYPEYVVSLATDDVNLYGDTGIISNPLNSGKEWERPCHVEIFTKDGNRVIAQDAGVRIFGGSSRTLKQKSFRLVARKTGYYDESKYVGAGNFGYPFFDGRTVIAGKNAGKLLSKYDRLVLRNGGNDSMQATAADPERMTLTRDAVANAFMAKNAPEIASQHSTFAAVYLNGQYYGILDMKEDINDDYIKSVYGLDKDYVTVIKSELDTSRHCVNHTDSSKCRFDDVWFYYEVDDGAESDLDGYMEMCRAARAALSGTKAEMNAAYLKLSEKLDVDSFMKYCAVSLFVCNTDWPHNNVRVWHYNGEPDASNPYSDGKWRFATRDMDFTFGRYKSKLLPELYTLADTDTIKFTLGNFYSGTYSVAENNYPDSLYLQSMLALCLHNDEFRTNFINFSSSLCSEENKTALKNMMNDYSNQIKNEIPYHINCWKGTISSKLTADVWNKNVSDMIQWANDRPSAFLSSLSQINTYFA